MAATQSGCDNDERTVGISGDRLLRIGQLAAELGLNPRTIRYYEGIGLLPAPQRSDAGYRLYTDADIERLRFVGKAKMIGLTLDEIRQIFKLRSDGERPCGCVLGLIDQKVAALDAQMRALASLRQELVALREQATQHEDADAIVCGIIEGHEPAQSVEAIATTAIALHRGDCLRRA
jgi:DNA-binding transcriptional MerR regulator